MMTTSESPSTGRQTRIVLVRHGDVLGITPPRFRGRADLPLTEHGVRQAEMTRDYLSHIFCPTAVCTSPLSRCVHTGEILARPYGLTTSPLAGFADIDYGMWQGRSYDEVQAAEPAAFASWHRTPHLAAIPGGESLHEVATRVAAVMCTILVQHRGETVFLVGHDSVNRVFLLLTLELPLSRFWHLHQDPCAINVLDHDEDSGWTVLSMNETAHLASGVRPL
jgi:phosphoserine phosphatase